MRGAIMYRPSAADFGSKVLLLQMGRILRLVALMQLRLLAAQDDISLLLYHVKTVRRVKSGEPASIRED